MRWPYFVVALVLATGCTAPPAKVAERFQFALKDYQLTTAAFHTDAHQKYLADQVDFRHLPDQGLPTGNTAVVGSDVCRFYPAARLETAADLGNLGDGVAVPFGTILPMTGVKVESGDGPHNGMFNYQENWNWFYPTQFQGKEGLVFGADLFGLDDSNEENRISAMQYNSAGKPTEFYPILGYQYLPEAVVQRVGSDRIAIQSVGDKEYGLWYSDPDDFIALYRKHEADDYSQGKWRRNVPIFVTTDLAAHALHLMFDRELQHVEQAMLLPNLNAFVADLLAALDTRKATSAAHQAAIAKARLYLQTGQALLSLVPTPGVEKDKYDRETPIWIPADKVQALEGFPDEVRREVALMDAHAGPAASPVFSFGTSAVLQEDYSQYIPRGHYTKNGVLGAYFRAMMWFGRIPFLMAAPGKTAGNLELTRAMTPVALVLVDTVAGAPELMTEWSQLSDPIGDLIGPTDDLTLAQMVPFWNAMQVKDFDGWVSDVASIDALVASAHESLPAPAISGNSVWKQPSEGSDRNAPMNWRLFGQRFTWDSEIHNEVSPPRLMSRDMVRGLDVMKALGSKTAEVLLQKSDYPAMPGLKPALDNLEGILTAKPAEFWTQNYYNLGLYLAKTQAQFEPGVGLFFTETPAWGQKAMLASHGTWAELRHDTILYAKQSYAERAGDGDFLPTFRTKPIPKPVHYLEPNVPFWQGAALAAQKLRTTLADNVLLDQEANEKLGAMTELLDHCVTIATLEAADQPVDESSLEFLARIPATLVHLVLIGLEPGEDLDDDQLKMAAIADVYTNLELRSVLEVGVGRPQRLYVALNDGQGGKRVAVGYTYSYYEFSQPMANRLTDKEWKADVYAEPPRLDGKDPFWARGLALPASSP